MIKSFFALVLFILGVSSCTSKNHSNVSSSEELLAGEYAKLWIFVSQDTSDCNCYYALLFRSGKARYMLRDSKTGTFIDWYNRLSGDVVNYNTNWSLKNDTLIIKGLPFLILNISKKGDSMTIQDLGVEIRHKRYLVDSKLINFP